MLHQYPPKISFHEYNYYNLNVEEMLMSYIEDKIFGKLHYGEGKLAINFFEKELKIDLIVDCEDEDTTFDDKQYQAYESLVKNWDNVQPKIAQAMSDYYKEKRSNLGYAFEEEDITYEPSEATAATIKYSEKDMTRLETIEDVIEFLGEEEAEFFGQEYLEEFLEEHKKIHDEFDSGSKPTFEEINERADKEEIAYGEATYPKIDTIDEMLKHFELHSMRIYCPNISEIYEERHDGSRVVALRFGVSWDEENGLGMILVNEEVKEVEQDAGL